MDDGATTLRTSSFHFQMYGPVPGSAVRWRLLSGNNRDMGRGVLVYRDADSCRAGIQEVLRRLDELDPIFVPDTDNTWRWLLRYKGEPVVTSGHSYDRKVRCREGHSQFLRHAPGAQIKDNIVISSARRWAGTSVIDLREKDLRDQAPPDKAAEPIPGQRYPFRSVRSRALPATIEGQPRQPARS